MHVVRPDTEGMKERGWNGNCDWKTGILGNVLPKKRKIEGNGTTVAVSSEWLPKQIKHGLIKNPKDIMGIKNTFRVQLNLLKGLLYVMAACCSNKLGMGMLLDGKRQDRMRQ